MEITPQMSLLVVLSISSGANVKTKTRPRLMLR